MESHAVSSLQPTLMAVFLLTGSLGYSADGTWNTAQTGLQAWSASGNWTGGVIPGLTTGATNTDKATFGSSSAPTQITIDSGRNLRSLEFGGTNALGLYTIGSAGANLGETLRLTSGGSISVLAGTTTVTTIDAPLTLEPASASTAGTYSLTNNANNVDNDPNVPKLNVTGNISGGITSAGITLNLTGSAGSRSLNDSGNIISGLISNGGAAQGLSIALTGADGGDRGAWRLSNNNNSFTGSVSVSAGTLLFTSIADSGVNSAIGAGSVLNINSGAHVKYLGGAASTNRTINGSGSFYSQGTGALTLTGTVTTTGTLNFRGGQNFIMDTVVTGPGGLSRTDNGTLFLNRVNTFSGNISVAQGKFSFATIAIKSVNSAIGAGTTITLGQNSNSVGTIEFTGTSGGSSDRDIRLSNGDAASSGNGSISNTVAGQTLTLSGTVRATNSNAAFLSSLNLTGAGNGVMSGVIGGTNANTAATIAMQLTKTGAGTWALSGANNYSRGTLISAGTLLATNTTGSATGTGNVITSGTGTLGGTGFITGGTGAAITIASGTRLMVGNTHQTAAGVVGTAGYSGAASQLSLGGATNVAITLAGTLQFDLFTHVTSPTLGQSDRLILATTASTITLGGAISVANLSNGGRPTSREGSWQIIDWTNASAATQSGVFTFDFANAPLASGYSWQTDNIYSTGVISVSKVAANHTWLGTTDANWSTAANWEAGTLPTSSTDVFFLNATSNLTQNINGDKNVRNLFFSGEKDYVINASGGVLYSHGTLTEVLGGTQRFGAQLRIANGTTSAYTIYNDGTLTFDSNIMWHRVSGSSSSLLNILFEGSGNTTVNHFQRRTSDYNVNIVKNGSGTLTLVGGAASEAGTTAGSITGTTTVNAGKLRLNNEGNLGSNPAAFNAGHLTLNGGTLNAYATFTIDDANRGVALGANGGTVEVDATHTLTVQTPVTGSGAFTKTGTGTLSLAGGSSHTGTTTVSAGTLQIASGGSIGTGVTSVSSGARLVGSGTVQASSFSLLNGAFLQAGDIAGVTSETGNGTLTFTPEAMGSYLFQTGSNITLSITGATNAGAIDPMFGSNLIGSSGYEAYVDAISGAGDHDRLVFNGTAGSTLTLAGNITVEDLDFAPLPGQIFNLLDWATLIATDFSNFVVGANRDGSGDDLSQFNLPDISGTGYLWDVSRFTTSGSIVVIPEPGRVCLLFIGLAALIARRRRS